MRTVRLLSTIHCCHSHSYNYFSSPTPLSFPFALPLPSLSSPMNPATSSTQQTKPWQKSASTTRITRYTPCSCILLYEALISLTNLYLSLSPLYIIHFLPCLPSFPFPLTPLFQSSCNPTCHPKILYKHPLSLPPPSQSNELGNHTTHTSFFPPTHALPIYISITILAVLRYIQSSKADYRSQTTLD